MRKTQSISSARHHWFPNALMRYWGDDDGWIRQVEPNGRNRPFKCKAGSIGSIANGHLIFKSGFWLGTAEDLFDRPDRQIGSTIERMMEAASRAGFVTRTELNAGTRAVAMDDLLLRAVGECVGSLIVRSPYVRNLITISVGAWGPYEDGIDARHHLIAANIANLFPYVCDGVARAPQKFILFSLGKELVFGDGFYSTSSTFPDENQRMNAFVPLTPRIGFACVTPRGPYRPGCFAVSLSDGDVESLNLSTQVYSRRYLFYRSNPPILDDVFLCCRHKIFAGSRFTFLDQLSASLKQRARKASF